MSVVQEQDCGICGVQKITHRGFEFCALCDNPPLDEAVWFIYWRYQEPP